VEPAIEIIRVGSVIRDYRLVKKLGEGAMGTVYEGVHEIIGKRVAIKVLKASAVQDQVAAKRMLEEARAVNAIQHEGVVDIYDVGMLPAGRPYLVMELLEGRSLHDEVRRLKRGLPVKLVVHVLEGVLSALEAAHRAGVIHRDLKASNVFLVRQRDGMPYVKLVDFGVARREGRQEMLTMPQMTVGSMGFMAPEHIAGHPVPQSDLYATGCLAWLMLAGKPVFPYGNPGVLMQQHLRTKPPFVSTLREEVSVELDAWVAWMLEKRAEDRPHTAEVALTTLHEAMQASGGMRTIPGGPKFIEVAKSYDARARSEARSRPGVMTEVTPAYIPAQKRPATTKKRAHVPIDADHPISGSVRPTEVMTPEAARTADEDTQPPEEVPFDPDGGTVFDSARRRRRR
jgi:serine/threonine-protein kinase